MAKKQKNSIEKYLIYGIIAIVVIIVLFFAISYFITQIPNDCTPNWNCDSWSTCSNNHQTRTCTDSNSCGTTTDKPLESQSCTIPNNEPSTLSEISNLVSQVPWNGASLIKTLDNANEVDYQESGYYDMVNPAQILIYKMNSPCLDSITSNFQIYNGFGDLGRPIYYYQYIAGDDNEIVTMYSWCGLSNPNINFQSNKDDLVRGYFSLI